MLYNRRGVSDYALYDEAGILERTGVTPAQYPEYAALRGDPSDNLPGVPGIGEKTAAKLVTTYGDARGDLRAPRRAAAEAAPEPRRDARTGCCSTGRCRSCAATCDVGVAADDLRQGAFDREQVRVLFDQLAFRTLLPRLMEAVGEVAAPSDAPRPTTLDVDVDDAARRRRPSSRASTSSRDAGDAYALERAVGAARRPQPTSTGSASPADDARRPLRRTATSLARARGARRARARWSTPAGRRSSRTGPRS